jgi:hypothetical protein
VNGPETDAVTQSPGLARGASSGKRDGLFAGQEGSVLQGFVDVGLLRVGIRYLSFCLPQPDTTAQALRQFGDPGQVTDLAAAAPSRV